MYTPFTRTLLGIVLVLVILAVGIASCAPAGPSTAQKTQDVKATQSSQADQTEQARLEATTDAMSVAATLVAENKVATATAALFAKTTGTAEAHSLETATVVAQQTTATAVVNAHSTDIAEQAAEATAQAQSMYDRILELEKNGQLKSTEGTYYKLDDFDESWAQLNWYKWTETDYAPTNFVLHANTAWKSASTIADWYSSGCGFVFREADNDNYYMVFLALSGYAKLVRMNNNTSAMIGRNYYGLLSTPNGGAEVMLVVEGNSISYFVNGERVLYVRDANNKAGRLAFTLVSGTNKDFGTNCRITDIELWELK